MSTYCQCIIACVVIGISSTTNGQINYPYNPDGNADTLIGVSDLQDLLSVYGQQFQADELIVNGVELSHLFDSLFILIQNQNELIESALAGPTSWSFACVENGISSDCSPQGGFCDEVSLLPNELGEYPISVQCDTEWDATDCVVPTWRTFQISGPGAGTISSLHLDKITNQMINYGGHYPAWFSRMDDVQIPFEVIDENTLQFSFWSFGEELTGLSIGTSYDPNMDWLNTYFSFFIVQSGKVQQLPFLVHF